MQIIFPTLLTIYSTHFWLTNYRIHNNVILSPTAQNHVLKKAVGDNEADFLIVVFMAFVSECQFHIFKPTVSGSHFRIARINTLHSPGVSFIILFSLLI